jgi:hypothetical protein
MALSALYFLCELEEGQTITRDERRRYRCFEDAAVIAYGRAFTKAEGLPFLVFKHMDLKPTPEEQALHHRLMDRRRKVVAHSDADRQRILFTTDPFDEGLEIMFPGLDYDDALAFFEDRWTLLEWLNRLIHAACVVVFEQVQGRPPIRFLRDHTQGTGQV